MRHAPDGTAFELTGPSGAPAVALIHGLGMPRPTWEPFVAALSNDYRVLTYHLYGHGESGPPPETPSLTVLSEQLRGLMDHVGLPKAAIVGFSLGGMINRRLAMDHPKRVSGLAILNSPHERGDEAQAQVEQRAKDTGAGGPGATLDATIARWFTPDFIANHPDVIETVRASVLANHPEYYTQCRWVLANGVVELIRPSPPITHPTLIMTCENDSGSSPQMSHAIASEIPGARTVIVPGLQHMGLLEHPGEFIDPLQEFLSANAR